jgi:3-deoxy-D-manno-octulosonate 8-phosphate phosphatase KdsC-like HAD superfamily phosphatase
MSDENGRYRIDITAQGQFYAGTLKRGYKEVRLMHTGAIMGLPVSLRADDVFDLRLVKFCSISGHVVDESGKPFQFAHMVTPRLGGRGHEIVGNPFFFR